MPENEAACSARPVVLHIDQKGIWLFKVSLGNSPGWSLVDYWLLMSMKGTYARCVLHMWWTGNWVQLLLTAEANFAGAFALVHISITSILGRMVTLLLSSAAVIVLSVANVGSCIMVIFSPSLLGSSALMPLTGFWLGYAVSAAFKLNDQYVLPHLPPLSHQEQRGRAALLCGAMVKPWILGIYFCRTLTPVTQNRT